MIKNLEKVINNTLERYRKPRKDVLEIINDVLKYMSGYNLVKTAVSLENDKLIINSHTFDINRYNKIFLVGFGKASGSMAQAMEEIIDIEKGVITTTEDIHLKKSRVLKGSHPLPTSENINNTNEIISIFTNAKENDLIICLISGGGSSLLCKPYISIESLVSVTSDLMKKGSTIEELNIVRKNLSQVKGGKLALKTQANVISIIISDIIGNPIGSIASGPTSSDTSTFVKALEILKHYNIRSSEAISFLEEKIEKGDKNKQLSFDNVHNIIIGDINKACMHARYLAEQKNYNVKIISTCIQGEAKDIGKTLADLALVYPKDNIMLIAGGETTVTVKGNGKGGRNHEFTLSAINKIHNENIVFISIGTDGIDGTSPSAGAIIDGYSYNKAKEVGLFSDDFLLKNDSYTFFKIIEDAIFTGPTGTNIMDIQIMLKL